MEPIYRQSFTVSEMHLDCFGRLKPSALLYFAQESAGAHCRLLNADWDTLQAQELFWAVTRQRLQITRLPLLGETVTVETWPMPTTKVAYPRSTVGFDSRGNELFRSVSLWVLMNTRSRSLVLPKNSGLEIAGICRGNELSVPGSLVPKAWEQQTCRSVRYSELDRNGHMNNTRYLDWVEDLLPSAFHAGHPARDITLCYVSEAREGEDIALSWQLSQDLCLQVDAHRQGTDDPGERPRIFTAQILF